MQATKVSERGALALPKDVTDARELRPGDDVHIDVRDGVALLSKTAFLVRAGSDEVSPDKRGLSWSEVRRQAWTSRWRKRS